jgi:hypothetical protein
VVRTDLDTGVRRDSLDLIDGFTSVHFHRPDEVPGEVADAGLRLDDLYAVEGMAQWMPDIAARLSNPDGCALVLELTARTEGESSTLGATAHVLVAARRKSRLRRCAGLPAWTARPPWRRSTHSSATSSGRAWAAASSSGSAT